MLRYLSQGSRSTMLFRAAVLIAAVAVVDWKIENNVSLGFLYLFPMLMVGACLDRWQIATAAAICTLLAELFDPFPFDISAGIPRVILVFAAFFGTGLFVFESAKNRRQSLQHVEEIEKEIELRRDAEEQLRVLVESSPAAIFTLNSDGRVLLANEAAHHLLGFASGTLPGEKIDEYLPALASVPPLAGSGQSFRTEMECHGRRQNQEIFLASAWFATYRTRSGPRLAAVVIDVSENLRDREESSLEQFMAGSRIVVATVCHEIRNLCGAISVVHANLGRNQAVIGSEDYRALGTLVEGLERIASQELQHTASRHTASEQMNGVDLASVLDELRIVIEPSLKDAGIEIHWQAPPSLPLVWAERHTLLQVFLNLTKNSERAMEASSRKQLTITAFTEQDRVLVRVQDSGPGITAPERLFQPFQPGAEVTGLGLYVSRALVRGFGGDLFFEPRAKGCCFTIALATVSSKMFESKLEFRSEPRPGSRELVENGSSAPPVAGRSHAVSGELGPAAGRRA